MTAIKRNKLHVRTGDTVVVLSGKSKGKRGKVLEVSPKEQKIIIEGINLVKKHVKPKRQGQSGGIVQAEGAVYACKVMAVCPKCDKPTRLAHVVDTSGEKPKTFRVCKHCGERY